MNKILESISCEALELPPDQRVALAHRLLTSIDVEPEIGAAEAENDYDGHALEPTLEQVERVAGYRPAVAIGDKGFRGQSHCGQTEVVTPGRGKKNASAYEKRKARKRFRRRAAIEPRIGHLKSDFRLDRNYLKGQVGDAINLLLAAAASNLSLWMRQVLLRLVWALRMFQEKCQGAQYPLPA